MSESYTICTEHRYIVGDNDHGSCPQCNGDRNLIVFVRADQAEARIWNEAIEAAARLGEVQEYGRAYPDHIRTLKRST